MRESYWINPNGDVIQSPQGHQSYIKEHWQEHNLPSDISLTDLVINGWVRVSGENVMLRQVDNPEVLTNLKQLLVMIGHDEYTFWINSKPHTISLETIESASIVDIYRDILFGKFEVPTLLSRTADADDQGMFEYQPSWGESESAGSTGMKDRGIEFMPQDKTKEVWWNRELLDYLRKNFPGKKDVIPPEPDIGYPSQASDIVDRMNKKAISDQEIVCKHNRGINKIDEGKRNPIAVLLAERMNISMGFAIQLIYSYNYHSATNAESVKVLNDILRVRDGEGEQERKVREWEERWHRRSSLQKKADYGNYQWFVDYKNKKYFIEYYEDGEQKLLSVEEINPQTRETINEMYYSKDSDEVNQLMKDGFLRWDNLEVLLEHLDQTGQLKAQPRHKTKTEEWEERWHKRSMLKQAETSSVKIDKLQAIADRNGSVPTSYRGHNAYYELDENYILHVQYYSTEIVTADMKARKILKVTTGGYDTISTKRRIRDIIDSLGYGYPDYVGYEYDASETDVDREKQREKIKEDEKRYRHERYLQKKRLIPLHKAQNPSTPPEELSDLARVIDDGIRGSVAENPNTSLETLTALSKDENVEVRRHVADNPHTPQEVLMELAQSNDVRTRQYVATNPSTSLEILQMLSKDLRHEVRMDVAENPNITADMLAEFEKDSNEDVQEAVKRNPKYVSEKQRKTREWEERWHRRGELRDKDKMRMAI